MSNASQQENDTPQQDRHQPATGGPHAANHDPWQLRPDEKPVLGTAAALIGVAAAIVEITGPSEESATRSLLLTSGTLLIGVPALVLATRLYARGKRKIKISASFATAVLLLTGALGGLIGYGIQHFTGTHHMKPGQTAAPSPPGTSTPPATPGQPAPGSGRLHLETTDNHLGTQVFRDPEGDAVQANQAIPYDTRVLVKCWTQNQSSMSSINAFYLIETSPWTGDYAPADTFANGDPLGADGSTALDPAVPQCS
jgi:hypothetical protein